MVKSSKLSDAGKAKELEDAHTIFAQIKSKQGQMITMRDMYKRAHAVGVDAALSAYAAFYGRPHSNIRKHDPLQYFR